MGLFGQRFFAARPLLVESNEEGDQAVPRSFSLGTVTTYDLSELQDSLRKAATASELDDARLSRALAYLQHAKWLFEQRAAMASPLDQNASLLISSVFLNIWKAVSSVVGDPSTDRDYQRRYKQLGFDYAYFKQKIERLKKLRDDYDVAHYSLDDQRLEELERSYGDAVEIATEVLLALVGNLQTEPSDET